MVLTNLGWGSGTGVTPRDRWNKGFGLGFGDMDVSATLFGGFVYLDGLRKSLRSKRIVQIGIETESFA